MLGEAKNKRIGFLFPGQGSQYVGMGRSLYEALPEVKDLYDKANEILEFDIARLAFDGPEDELRKTVNTQPAILIHSVAVSTVLLKSGIRPFSAAGHSLGEYSALVSAGAISFEDGLRLVRIRGDLMYKAGLESPGGMAAILGMTREKVEVICEEAGKRGIIQLANLNSPGQIVISGEIDAIGKAVSLAKERGAKRAVRLDVSGAFHSPLMGSASEGLREALSSIKIVKASFPVVANFSASFMVEPGDIRESLDEQLLSPVRWEESMRKMLGDGARVFIEVGPGNVLKGLIRSIDRSAETYVTDNKEVLTQTIERLRELIESKV